MASISFILYLFVIYSFSDLRVLAHSIDENQQSDDLTTAISKNEHSLYELVHPLIIGGEFSKPISLQVNRTTNYIIEFIYKSIVLEKKAIRVGVRCINSDYSHPLLVVVRQQREVLSWQLPLDPPPNTFVVEEYLDVTRTLCPVKMRSANGLDSMQQLFVDISTSSRKLINFTIQVDVVENFTIGMATPKTIVVSPSKPRYYRFKFPNEVGIVLVRASSEDDICAMVSIQNISCPVFDLEENIRYGNFYQTMTMQAGITVRKGDYPYGFYVVTVILSNDEACSPGYQHVLIHREKRITLYIEEKISYREYLEAIFAGIIFCIFFYIITIILACREYIRAKKKMRNSHRSTLSSSVTESGASTSSGPSEYETAPSSGLGNISYGMDVSTCSSLDEEEYDILEDVESEKDIFRTKSILFLSDLARKDTKVLRHKSSLYVFGLLTIAIFYAVPVMQLLFTHQKVLDETGNQDLCFYNFLCAHPFGPLGDFNHVYSNIAYFLFGILCIGLCARREYRHNREMKKDKKMDKCYGIPQHFGMCYAIGGALIMEGILSGCYHICPSQSNFQFDSAFMYVIAVLSMLKIYQTRHPDINASANMSYLALAFAVLIGVIGVLTGTIYFWIFFGIVHVTGCLLLSAQIYFMGRWKIRSIYPNQILFWFRSEIGSFQNIRSFLTPMYCDRMILLIFGNVANLGISIFGIVTTPKDFSSHLVIIFMSNLLLYMIFYIIMKLRHGESLLFQPIVYLCLMLTWWGVASYFFLWSMTSWELTPAHSRQFNHKCLILNFYDSHDIWHFASAAGMFFGFMLLLTLDDDLINTPREKIPVF